MTSGLEDHYGDIHLNTSTQQYWVFEKTWEMKSEYLNDNGQVVKVAFTHPFCKENKGVGKYIWNLASKKWSKAGGKYTVALPGEVEVNIFCFKRVQMLHFELGLYTKSPKSQEKEESRIR